MRILDGVKREGKREQCCQVAKYDPFLSLNSSVNYVHGFNSEGAANFENERVASESLRCSAEVVGWWGPDLGTTSAREKVPLDRK